MCVVSAQLTQELELMKQETLESWQKLEEIEKKVKNMARDARVTGIKAVKTVSQLKKSTDVAIYEMFNKEIERKEKLGASLYKSAQKNLKENTVPKRIEKVIDFYVKRQQVPDPEMHIYLVQLERKIGELASHVKKSYNIDRINLTLLGMALLLVAIYRQLEKPDKVHTM